LAFADYRRSRADDPDRAVEEFIAANRRFTLGQFLEMFRLTQKALGRSEIFGIKRHEVNVRLDSAMRWVSAVRAVEYAQRVGAADVERVIAEAAKEPAKAVRWLTFWTEFVTYRNRIAHADSSGWPIDAKGYFHAMVGPLEAALVEALRTEYIEDVILEYPIAELIDIHRVTAGWRQRFDGEYHGVPLLEEIERPDPPQGWESEVGHRYVLQHGQDGWLPHSRSFDLLEGAPPSVAASAQSATVTNSAQLSEEHTEERLPRVLSAGRESPPAAGTEDFDSPADPQRTSVPDIGDGARSDQPAERPGGRYAPADGGNDEGPVLAPEATPPDSVKHSEIAGSDETDHRLDTATPSPVKPLGKHWWRRHSLWPFISLIPWFGAWAPIYAGVKARQRTWIMLGILWSAIAVASFIAFATAPSGQSGLADVGGILLLVGWTGAIATSFVIRGSYDRQMASPLRLAAEAREARLEERRQAQLTAVRDPSFAREIGVGRPDQPGAFDGGLVDVNNAPGSVLSSLPRIDDGLATRIVEARAQTGGFSSLEDLGTVLDLPGDLVDGLRDRVVFLPR
jgi:DNA uptake protein ComE-like DNA-binding protein